MPKGIYKRVKKVGGWKLSNEIRLMMSEEHKGKKHSKKTLKKMSEIKLGNKNPMFGKKHSKESKEKIRKSHIGKKHSIETRYKIKLSNIGKNIKEKSGLWKGDNIKNSAKHGRMIKNYGQPSYCENREKNNLSFECSRKSKNYEWCNKDHKYSLERENWMRLCTSCHRRHDIYNNLININGKEKIG